MVQSAHGIVELVIVNKAQPVVDLRLPTTFGIIECGFIEVHRAFEVALG